MRAFHVGHDAGQGRPVHPLKLSDDEAGGHHGGSRVAHGHHPVGPPLAHELGGHPDGAVLFFLQDAGGLVLHDDGLGGVDHLRPGHQRGGESMAGQLRSEHSFIPDEEQEEPGPGLEGLPGALQSGMGGVVASHGIQRDAMVDIHPRKL